MNRYVLGIDVGIASVGWGIIDLNKESVVDAGVRIFKEGTAANNADRRSFRSSRRLVRRRQQRVKDMKKLLIKNKIINNDFESLNDPYDIRIKGLTKKLTNEELATALLHITKKRGLVNSEFVPDEADVKDNQTSKKTLSHNKSELGKKYICELQKERLENGKVRGTNNLFYTEDYIRELKQIFSNQKLNKKVEKEVINIIRRKREYYDGPGSEKSPTPYGRFFFENGKLVKVDMIEKMRGKCTFYPDEPRAPKMSYTADLFNLLNDLNNLSYNGEKIMTPELKKEVIENYINKKGNITPLELIKLLGLPKNEIKGFRIDKNDKPLLTEFKGYKKIQKCIKDNKLNERILDNKQLLDSIIDILTSKKGANERIESITSLNSLDKKIFSKKAIECLSNLSGFTGYHSLSLKAMNEIIEDLLNTEYNQMEIFSLNNYFQKNNTNKKGLESIPINVEDVYSPVVKRSKTETIKIINALRKKYGEFESIVIEMPRDRNSDEQRKRIKEFQKRNEQYNKEAMALLDGKKGTLELKQKLRLYKEQDGKCLYSGKCIDLKTLISDPYMYEIDHIIPLSISLDDSFENKVLVLRDENHKKGNLSPYMYFKTKTNANYNYEDYKKYVLSLYESKKIRRKRKDNLLFEEDINKYEVKQKFINRNLSDTRYASREILNDLSSYFKQNDIPTTVHTIRGTLTSLFRKKSDLPKDRDEDYKHHAIDALIIAALKKMKLTNALLNVSLYKTKDELLRVDSETGEIITKDNEKNFLSSSHLKFISNLDKVEVKYSHKVDRKFNRAISNQTIYSSRIINNDEYVIGKCSDIYSEDGKKIAEFFRKGTADQKLLMYNADVKTFEKLQEIVSNYPKEENPFLAFKEETGELITKVSKSKKAPIIKSLKYYDKKLNNCIDISHHYKVKKANKVVLLSLNPYRIDLYKRENGEYAFIQIYQHHIKKENNHIFIPEDIYNNLLEERKITKSDKFMFSIYKNEMLKVEPYKENATYFGKILYNGVQNLGAVIINYNCLNKPKLYNGEKEVVQPYLTIKNLTKIEKIDTNEIGDEFTHPIEVKPKLIIK